MNEYQSGTITIPSGSPYAGETKAARRVVSIEESEQTEKTLHHLAGRVQELRARLERVLVPATAVVNSAGEAKVPVESASPLTDRLRSFRRLAQDSIDGVEDILNRLDV